MSREGRDSASERGEGGGGERERDGGRGRERERERRESEIIKADLNMNAGVCQSGLYSTNYPHQRARTRRSAYKWPGKQMRAGAGEPVPRANRFIYVIFIFLTACNSLRDDGGIANTLSFQIQSSL